MWQSYKIISIRETIQGSGRGGDIVQVCNGSFVVNVISVCLFAVVVKLVFGILKGVAIGIVSVDAVDFGGVGGAVVAVG